MKRRKLQAWWLKTVADETPGTAAVVAQSLLLAATLPFQAVSRLRGFFYDTRVLPALKLPVPVVSFGNLTAGGTGKTPAVIWCARYLAEKGLKPGIASRGYNPDAASPAGPNDEALLIGEHLPGVPHVWNADRAAAGAELVKAHRCDVVILDDGFQHRRLRRTLDFLLVDALNPFGYGYMMPRGLLREPLSALRRATHIIITRSNLVGRDELVKIRQRIRQFDENMKLAEAAHKPIALSYAGGRSDGPGTLRGKRVFVFCGIANPQSLLITLSNLGAAVAGVNAFPDHHVYADDEIDAVFKDAESRNADLVVTTEKDRVKCGWREGSRIPLAELKVEFELVRGKETVESALDFLAAGQTEGRSG